MMCFIMQSGCINSIGCITDYFVGLSVPYELLTRASKLMQTFPSR